MKLKSLVLTILFTSIAGFSQETNPIQTDRPNQSASPSLTPKGMFQVETGFSFQKNQYNNKTNTLPSSLWKFGLNDNLELRLITEFISNSMDDETYSGFNPISLGCKIKIADEKGIIPQTSFIGHITLPKVASASFKTDYYAPEFRFVMQNTLSEKIAISYNLGAKWNGFTPEPTFIYTLSTGYSITNKLGSYIELFGFAPQKNKSNHSIDGGLTYLISNNFMIDVSAGLGITDNAPDNYFATGFSFRI
jgi:hypothetical protein